MALGNPRILFGVHSMSPYARSTGLPYGLLKVIGGATIAMESDVESLFGGSSKYAWAAESKTVSSNITAKVKAYPGFLFSLFLGGTVTDAGADTSGAVSTLTNVNGTSLKNATTGIASIAVKAAQKANLKFGKYVLKVLTATTVGVYSLSDIDSTRGTDFVYTDDTLLVTLTIATITTGGTIAMDDLGLELTGGSGTIGMTAGDTATFEVKPPSSASTTVVVGADGDTMPAFGAIFLAQKRATGEMFEIDGHNIIGSGLPIAMEEMAFSVAELKMTCIRDNTLNRVFSIRHIIPT